ncbi:hypothetical protein E3I18_00440 [Candidatus Woesebacteria bacterium]|jgi:hypothetical protein|nr:MAG: hypothetical protein E3I18_00440 [Candidatus Woesebacteria bacterium]
MEKQKRPSFVIIGILTVVTIFLWISFSVYRAFTITPSIKVPDDILKPITSSLDTETLSKIDQRAFFEEGEISQILISLPSPSPAATPTPTETETEEVATESASPATESAELQL